MKFSALLRRVLTVALLILGAALLVLGVVSFQRKVVSFQPLGFSAQPAGDHWLVTPLEPTARPLLPGDRILLVNGESVVSGPSLADRLRGQAESTLVVLRGDRLETLTYARPPLAIDWPYLVLAAIGAAYLLIGLYTFWRRPGSALFLAWALASAVVYVLSPTFPADALGKLVYLAEELARLLLPPLTLHLFLTVPPDAATPARRRVLWRSFLYLPAAALIALQLDLVVNNGRYLFGTPTRRSLAQLDRLELVLLLLFAAISVAVLLFRLKRSRDWEQHRQLQWLAVGMAGGYAPFAVFYVLPRAAGLAGPTALTALSVVPLALVPLSFAYAILRYRLWDLGVIVRDGLSYAVTLVVGLTSFSVLDLLIVRALPEHLGLTRNVLSFITGIAIAGLVVPTQRGVSTVLERLHYRTTFGRRRALLELGHELLQERDLDRLCNSLLTELERGLDLDRAALYLAQEGALLAVRPEPDLPVQLDLGAFGPGAWERELGRLSGVELPGQALSPAQRLFLAGYRYLFPLALRENRIGMLVTGLKRGGQPLNSEDLELLRGLLNQAALALENAQLLEQVHRQLAEMVQLKRHNEGIIESSPAGIALLDGQGRVASANLAFAALTGHRRSEVLGQPLVDLLPLGPLPRPEEGLREVSFVDRLGTERTLHVSTAPLHDGLAGEQCVLVLQDVTERVAMENALKEKDRLASLGMLAAGVAHEVNTPLTGISSYAQMLLAETAAEDPRRALLEKVEKQTFRAAKIVNGLLEFARNRQDERRPVDLAALLAECVDLLRERLSRRAVAVVWEGGVAEAQVLGNEGELQQVLTNLLLNAVDAMATQGGGTLTLAVAARGEVVRATIGDNGPGIPPEYLDRVFQPFFSTKLGQGGTGLGLSISYNIVQQHGGRLCVDSRPGEGCRFTVELPRLTRTVAGTP